MNLCHQTMPRGVNVMAWHGSDVVVGTVKSRMFEPLYKIETVHQDCRLKTYMFFVVVL